MAWVAVALGHVWYLRRSGHGVEHAMNRPGDPALEVDDPREARVRCHACDRSYIAQGMDRDPTAGHQAICAECATSPAFYRTSRGEAKRSAPPTERVAVLG